MAASFNVSKAIVLDVDGTLYSSLGLKVLLTPALLYATILSPKLLTVINSFRELRERKSGEEVKGLADQQYMWAAQELGIPANSVKDIIVKWMHQNPLAYLPLVKHHGLEKFILFCREHQKIIVFYSDYPIVDKIKMLNISQPYLAYSAEDDKIDALKPSPKGLKIMMQELNLNPSECVMIGDRTDRDEAAAKTVGMPCWIIGRDFKDYADLKKTLEAK